MGLALASVLSGCGTIVPTSTWPGLIVAGGVVYVTTPQGKLYALSAETGAQQWEYPVKADQKAPKPFTALAAGEGLIYVGSFENKLLAVDPTNSLLRASDLPKDATVEKWKFDAKDAVVGAPAVDGKRLYVGSSDRNVYALDATNGSMLWNYTTGHWVWATPTVASSRIYVGSLDHNLYSLDAATGQMNWKFEAGGAIASQAALQDGVLYFGALDGKVYAVDAERGEKLWEFSTGNWVWSEPVIADGTVFVTSIDHKVYALDTQNKGAKVWEFDAGNPIRAGAALGDKTLYVVTDSGTTGEVLALDAATGKPQWKKTLPKGSLTTPVVAEDVLYVADLDGRVTAFKRASGLELWTFTPRK